MAYLPAGRFVVSETLKLTGSDYYVRMAGDVNSPLFKDYERMQKIVKLVDTNGKADVYSLAVVAFECLAGRKPFVADTPVGTAIATCLVRVPRRW